MVLTKEQLYAQFLQEPLIVEAEKSEKETLARLETKGKQLSIVLEATICIPQQDSLGS